jgi:hypothetical protein
MRMWKLALITGCVGAPVLGVAVYSGCFSPNYGDGFPCGPTNECPADYRCVSGRCFPGTAPIVGPVTATVYDDNGLLAPDVNVIYQDPQGHPVAVVKTDANGTATHDLAAGGMITAATSGSPGNKALRTAIGLFPGQNVIFGSAPFVDPIVGTVTIQLPGPAPVGATDFEVDLGCRRFNTDTVVGTMTVSVPKSCVTASNNFTIVAYARDATGDLALAWTSKRNIGIATTGTVDIGFQWQTTFRSFQLVMTNAPPRSAQGCSTVDGGPSQHCAEVSTDLFANGIRFSNAAVRNHDFNIVAGGNATVSIPYADAPFDSLRYNISISFGPTASDGAGEYIKQLDHVPDSETIDLGANMLPRVSNLVLNTTDPAHIGFSWNSDAPASLAAADALFTVLSWPTPSDGGGTVNHSWIIIAPAATPSPLALPELPREVSDWAPFTGVTFDDPGMLVFDISTFKGYTDFMNQLGFQIFGVSDPFPTGNFTARASGSNFH